MRYIDKDYSTYVVRSYESESEADSLDETSLRNPSVHCGMTGRQLWHRVRDLKVIPHFWEMKKQLMQEQGGICCYCGLKISFDNDRKATIEHLVPKSHRELVGEYHNLLLCCSATEDENDDIKRHVAADRDVKHCDDTKEGIELHYTPLQTDCDTRFQYDITGHVRPTDSDSATDLQTLNLDCPALVDRRNSALDILFDNNGDILPDKDLSLISSAIMDRRSDGTFREFCFVIKNVIDNILIP